MPKVALQLDQFTGGRSNVSRELINYAQINKSRYNDKQVTFDCMFFDKKFPINGFDMILARFSIEHTIDIDSLIKASFQKLRKQGLFAIIEYYVDNGNLDDQIWKEFKRREMATYRKLKSHPRVTMDLPMFLSRCGFKDIKSSFLQISPSTVGIKPFYQLARTEAHTCAKLSPTNWPKSFLCKFEKWCNKMSKENSGDPMFFLTHTVGRKP